MGQKQNPSTGDPPGEPKKRRRVGFAASDSGIDPNDCIKIYLVSSKEEVGDSSSFCIASVDLNSFFDDTDGKIYGYTGLKINVWVSALLFHSYADVTFESTHDGGKGITDLKSALQNIFGDTLVESKDEFLLTFSADDRVIGPILANGEKLRQKNSNELTDVSDTEVIRMVIGKTDAGLLYSRLVPMVLLLIDGSNPIDVTDPNWELFVLIQKKQDGSCPILLGFAAVYRFYHYPDQTRLRLGQILMLPLYQRKGNGRHLVEAINNVAVSEDVYDLTVEEPLDHFQHMRTCVDVQRLLAYDPVKEAVNSSVAQLKQGKLSKKVQIPRFLPPSSIVDDVRKTLKINKIQLLQCWEVLIYLGLDPIEKYMEDFVTIVSNRIKGDILGKDSGSGGKQVIDVPSDYDPETSFVMFKSGNSEGSSVQMDENQPKQEEQLQQLVDERIKEIKLIAEKVSRGA